MRIRVDDIPESGRVLHFHWDRNRLKDFMPPNDPFEMETLQPVSVDLEVHKGADHVRIRGSFSARFQLQCHRCLDPYPWQLLQEVDTLLLVEKHLPEEEEVELEPEDLEVEFFDGEEIDIDRLVAEEVFLALPFRALCSEECRGLCPGCGANLNRETCRCSKSDKKSPFQALERLRSQWSK
jgi:uncharacterized protein